MTVVNINTLYPSQYLKAADLQGKAVTVAIKAVIMEKIGSDVKPVLYFQNKEKGMVLNKTNGMTIAQAYGPDTENWTGGSIVVFPAYVDFQGKQVEGLRVRIPERGAQAVAPVRVAPNARDRAMAAQAPVAEAPPYDDGLDDEIPF
jgi:arabinogalactan endo-1,4-beta-galactosidase